MLSPACFAKPPRITAAQCLWAAVLFYLSPCFAAPLGPGDYHFELKVDHRTRSYDVHVPSQAQGQPLPLIVSLHGGGGNARQHREDTGMDANADKHGYIVAYPNGSGVLENRLLTWNAGFCCGYAQTHHIDDVRFITLLLDDLVSKTPIDPSRVYAAGHSNGGMMAHRLGVELADRFAAIASVSGAYIPPAATSGRAIPVLHIHSTDDPRALYNGGLGPPFPMTNNRVMHPAVENMMQAWASRNGCSTTPTALQHSESSAQTAQLLDYDGCRDGVKVMLWKLSGSGHGWPGGRSRLTALIGPPSTLLDANEEIWTFFSQFSRTPNTHY